MNTAVDLDGTLCSWKKTRDGTVYPIGEWLPGATNALRHLCTRGTVVVHSCRATWPAGGGWRAIATLLATAGFQPELVVSGASLDDINTCVEWNRISAFAPRCRDDCATRNDDAEALCSCEHPTVGIWVGKGKPIANVYVDDAAVAFDGDWAKTLRTIHERYPL